jgi:hypothetical protein
VWHDVHTEYQENQWGSDGSEDVDVGLLGSNVVWTYLPTSPHSITTKKASIEKKLITVYNIDNMNVSEDRQTTHSSI